MIYGKSQQISRKSLLDGSSQLASGWDSQSEVNIASTSPITC